MSSIAPNLIEETEQVNNYISVVSTGAIPVTGWSLTKPGAGSVHGRLSGSKSTAISTTPGQDEQDGFRLRCTQGCPLILICCTQY